MSYNKYFEFKKLIIVITLSIIIISCHNEKKKNTQIINLQDSIAIIKETFLTKWDEIDNVDSPTFWKDNKNNWIIATAKSTDRLIIYDALSGIFIKTFGKSGENLGEFKRPNGILVIDDLLFVVERDNHRVQVLSLPEFKPLLAFGNDELLTPYGISAYKKDSIAFVYITDNYEFEEDKIPPRNKLDKRIKQFKINLKTMNVNFLKSFGDTTIEGALNVVESIYCDFENNHLLIAEEDSSNVLKLYDLEGNYLKQIIGKGFFKDQIEGIALYKTGEKTGYWIITDQSDKNNVFHIFDRQNFKHINSFKGNFTLNTDGVVLTQIKYERFPEGIFFACNDDGGVSAFSIDKILKIIK